MGLIICFSCGHQKQVTPIKKHGNYVCSNCGRHELCTLTRRSARMWVEWSDKEGVSLDEAKYKTYGALRRIAESKGYSKGWCAHKFRAIFGEWPNGHSAAAPEPAPAGLLWWIRKGNAAWKKQKRKEEELRLAGMGGGVSGWGADRVVDAASELMTNDDWDIAL